MTIEKLEGIVMSETNYSESSKILNVFTKEYGKIGILSKGCRGLKSKLRGVSRKLVYGFFHVYYKPDGLSTLIGVDVIDPFKELTSDLTKITYASYLLELVDQVVRQTEDEEIFPMFKAALCKINQGFDPLVIMNIVELKLLDALGVRPMIDCCAICGNTSAIVTLDSSYGGYLCASCHTNQKIVSDKTIKLLRALYYVDIDKIEKIKVAKETTKELNEFIDDYYDRYTGLYLKSKKFLQNLNKITQK